MLDDSPPVELVAASYIWQKWGPFLPERLSTKSLRKLSERGEFPPYIKMGRGNILFERRSVDEFFEEQVKRLAWRPPTRRR